MSKNKIFSFFISAFLIGVFIAPLFPFNDSTLFITFVLLFILTFIFRKNLIVKIAALSAIFLIFGFWRFYYSVPRISLDFLAFYNGKEVEIEGFISSYPQEKDKSETFEVSVSKIRTGEWRDTKGKVYVLTSKLKDFEYGEKITLKGILEKAEDSEDSGSFFKARGIYSKMISPEIKKGHGTAGNSLYTYLFKVRKTFEQKVDEVFAEPFSSLVLGIILGVKRVSKDLLSIFNIVSISHIIVVSGYNISIVADFFKKIFKNLSRRLSFWLPFLAIIFFTLLVGAEPPVVRAAIMASILLFAKSKGRKANGVFMLLFAAFLIVIFNPFLLKYDAGFQLSFMSTLGLVLISDKFLEIFKKIKIPFVFSEALSSTLAAQLFILPIIIFYFGRLSIVSPIANLLILPLVPFIMFSSSLIAGLGFFSLSLARFFSSAPSLLLSYLINVSTFLSKISYASLFLKKSAVFVYFYYSVLFFPYLIKKKNENTKAS